LQREEIEYVESYGLRVLAITFSYGALDGTNWALVVGSAGGLIAAYPWNAATTQANPHATTIAIRTSRRFSRLMEGMSDTSCPILTMVFAPERLRDCDNSAAAIVQGDIQPLLLAPR
jgi:hypothetical protein